MTVKLTYYKANGKYYTEGEYAVDDALPLFEVWEDVRRLRQEGKLPGLVDGAREFIISVDVPSHPHNHPHLLVLR